MTDVNHRVCLPDSQKSWIAKSFMIKDEIQLRYFDRKTKQITTEKQNENDLYLVRTFQNLLICIVLTSILAEWNPSHMYQYSIESSIQRSRV
jgi:hypothetical protein